MSKANFEVSVEPDVRAVVSASGELDIAAAEDFRDALRAAQAGAPDVVVDLSRVTFMDSTCFNAILKAHRSTPRGGGLHAVGASPTLRRLFGSVRAGQLLLGEKGLTWRLATPTGGGWRQWITDEKSEEGVAAAEILEVGSWAGYDPGDAYYVLETDSGTSLYGSLEDAMKAAEDPGSVPTLTQRPAPSRRRLLA